MEQDNQVLDSTNSPEVSADTAQEKLFSRDQLAKIVASESAKAAQAARQVAEEKHQRDMEALNAQRAQQEQRNAQVPRDVDADAMYQQVTERFNKEMQERHAKEAMQQIANNYLSKVEHAKATYQDFDEVAKDHDPTAFPQLTFLIAGMDKGGDVLNDLLRNPLKMAGLDALAQRNPKQAQAELGKLAQSISVNQQAQSDAQDQTTAAPLDRLQPSRVSGSNGKMGIRDLRNQSWLRG